MRYLALPIPQINNQKKKDCKMTRKHCIKLFPLHSAKSLHYNNFV